MVTYFASAKNNYTMQTIPDNFWLGIYTASNNPLHYKELSPHETSLHNVQHDDMHHITANESNS